MLTLTRSTLSNPTGLNREFFYNGKSYPINLAYDTVLSFYKLLDDAHFSDAEKVSVAFEMFFNMDPPDADFVVDAFKSISKYLSEDPYEISDGSTTSAANSSVSQKYYSFVQDAEAIYASFFQQYHIDLLEEKQKMHWDKFKALFAGLGPDTYFMRIVHIRQEDATKLDGQAQTELIQAQQRYALEDSESQEAVEAQITDFGNMLMSIAKS